MNLTIFMEHRFQRTPDGKVWSPIFHYEMWTRYLRAFSGLTICARVEDVATVGNDVGLSTGDGVRLAGLPYYHGPREYLQKRRAFRAALAAAIVPGEAYIVRVPGNIANQATGLLQAAGLPYAIEAIGDPWDTFSPGSSTHPLRSFFRRWFTRSMRAQCARAAVSLYVTEHALQRRYPPRPGTPTFHASNVFLAKASSTPGRSAFVEQPRTKESFTATPLRFVCVGSFNLLYKAQDDLVNAFAQMIAHGIDGHLSFVGHGLYRPAIEALVGRHVGLKERVTFLGQLRGGAAVREVLDQSHIFVLPSRQEGLPRAALEAMARGLPCIGSDVGGFPEILPPDAIVPANRSRDLAACMIRLAQDPGRLAAISALNLRRAADFQADQLAVRQNAFYDTVREHFTRFWKTVSPHPSEALAAA